MPEQPVEILWAPDPAEKTSQGVSKTPLRRVVALEESEK
jgi:hypothetical protein